MKQRIKKLSFMKELNTRTGDSSNASSSVIKQKFERIRSRYEENENTIDILKCKEKVCQILDFMVQIRNDIRLTKFLKLFK